MSYLEKMSDSRESLVYTTILGPMLYRDEWVLQQQLNGEERDHMAWLLGHSLAEVDRLDSVQAALQKLNADLGFRIRNIDRANE